MHKDWAGPEPERQRTMKEKLYTIPLNDAVNANDECPFCYIERNVEQNLLDYVLGSSASYMESDTRDMTDKYGFCREHIRKMYDYGNTLGNAWILKTHYKKTIAEMQEQFKKYSPRKLSLKEKLAGVEGPSNNISEWTKKKDCSCYICNRFAEDYKRYMDTFFYLYAEDSEFARKIDEGKGFCLHHFGELCDYAEVHLSEKEKKDFFPKMFEIMNRNMERLFEDISWLIEKFDYRNKDADWKNSRDAVGRGMQKLRGSYPADPPYTQKK